jgi:VIT1/CCC1 family predicted Fe2+/Mn2+ transporter
VRESFHLLLVAVSGLLIGLGWLFAAAARLGLGSGRAAFWAVMAGCLAALATVGVGMGEPDEW